MHFTELLRNENKRDTYTIRLDTIQPYTRPPWTLLGRKISYASNSLRTPRRAATTLACITRGLLFAADDLRITGATCGLLRGGLLPAAIFLTGRIAIILYSRLLSTARTIIFFGFRLRSCTTTILA